MNASASQRGFTLVEVLVALVVMSILSGLAWQAVDGMVRSKQAVDEKMQTTLTLGTALAQWEHDFQDLVSEAPVPTVHFDGVRLRLTRRHPQGVQLVVWSLRQGLWQRWAAPPTALDVDIIQGWAAAAQLTGREAGHITLAEGVQSWQLFFFRGNAWSNAQSAGDGAFGAAVAARSGGASGTSGSNPNNTLIPNRERMPMGVRMVLATAAGNLNRDVLVPGGQP